MLLMRVVIITGTGMNWTRRNKMDDLFDGVFGFILKYFVGGSILLHLALIFVCSFARVSSLSEMASEYHSPLKMFPGTMPADRPPAAR